MNILLFDGFAKQFAQLGNVTDWVLLDLWNACNNQRSWEDVQNVFLIKD